MNELAERPLAIASLLLKYGGTAQDARAVLEAGTGNPRTAPAALLEWRSAREQELAALRDEGMSLAIAATALYELDSLLHDLRYDGIAAWAKYPVPFLEIAWYFREITKIAYAQLTTAAAKPLVGELANKARTLAAIAHEGEDPRHSSDRKA